MGQRIQVIIRTPKKYYNEGNPNNDGEQVFVYHNQWLYGMNFVKWTARFLRALKRGVDDHESQGGLRSFPLDLDPSGRHGSSILANAINHANHADLDYMTNTNLYNGSDEGYKNDNLGLVRAGSATKFLEYWDNNNGYLYVEVDAAYNITYDILTGRENDSRAPRSVTAYAYAHQFYKTAEREAEETFTDAITEIGEFEKVNAKRRLEQLRTTLRKMPEYNIQATLEIIEN